MPLRESGGVVGQLLLVLLELPQFFFLENLGSFALFEALFSCHPT